MFRARIRSSSDRFARKYPAILMTGAVCAVILPALIWAGIPFFLATLPGFLLVCAAMALFPLRTATYRIALPALAGAFSLFLHERAERADPLLELFRNGPGRCEVRLRISDSSASPGVSFLPKPKRLEAEVTEVRGLDGVWRALHAKVLVHPKLKEEEETPGYGDEWEADGMFQRPEESPGEGWFDYRVYLERRGIHYFFRPKEWKKTADGSGLLRALYDVRSFFLERVCAKMTSREAQLLAPGILYGIVPGTPPETKRNFMESGMIHLLSVSGTHVMLFAGLMLALFAFLPYRIRFLCVIGATYLYTESTGMSLPAFRAFLMFALYLGLRAFHLRSVPLNTLFLAAFLLLVYDPENLRSVGFQFSFSAVGTLLLANRFFEMHAPARAERFLLTPSRWISVSLVRMTAWKQSLFRALAGCLIAWLSSIPLSLLYQGIWTSGAAAANLLAMPLVFASFLFFFGGCLMCVWAPAAGVFTFLLNLSLRLVCAVAEEFARLGFLLPKPQMAFVALFLILLVVMLCAKRKRIAMAALIPLCLLIVYWNVTALRRTPEAVLFTDGMNFSLSVLFPESSDAVTVSLPDINYALKTASLFESRGITHCAGVYAANNTRLRGSEAVKYLNKRLPVLRSVLDTPVKSASLFPCGVPERIGRRRVWHSARLDVTEWEDGRITFEVRSVRGRSGVTGMVRESVSGGKILELRERGSGRELLREEFYPSSRMKIERIAIKTEEK